MKHQIIKIVAFILSITTFNTYGSKDPLITLITNCGEGFKIVCYGKYKLKDATKLVTDSITCNPELFGVPNQTLKNGENKSISGIKLSLYNDFFKITDIKATAFEFKIIAKENSATFSGKKVSSLNTCNKVISPESFR